MHDALPPTDTTARKTAPAPERKFAAHGSAARFSACFPRDPSTRLAGADADLAGWRELVRARGLAAVSRWSATRLEHEARLPRALASRFAAAFALGRAVERARVPARPVIRDARGVRDVVLADVRGTEREQFFALLLDGRHRLQRRVVVGVGTLTCSLVHPREVFSAAVREGAAAVVVAHNHPSGDPAPSGEDLEVTRRLVEAGQLLGIPLVDHVVVAVDGCVSLRELHPELGFARATRA